MMALYQIRKTLRALRPRELLQKNLPRNAPLSVGCGTCSAGVIWDPSDKVVGVNACDMAEAVVIASGNSETDALL
jgi:hypothetical protein